MAGRILSVRLLHSLQTRSPTSPLKPFGVLLSHSLLNNFLSSRFFSSRRASNAARKEKSLIEEEAELSDWISDLKTDSLRVGFSSDNEDDSNRRSSGRGTGKFQEGEKFRGGDRNLKSSRGSVKKRGFYRDEDDDEGFSPPRERGGRGGTRMSETQKGSRGKGFAGRSGRGRKDLNFDFSDVEGGSRGGGFSSRRKDGGAGKSERSRGGKSSQRGAGMDFGLSEEEAWDESDKGFTSKRLGGGGHTSVRQRGGKICRGARDLDFSFSKEEVEPDSDELFSFSEEDFIPEEEDKKKEGLGGGHTGTGLRSEELDGGERVENTVRSSAGDNDSYLSQKR